MPTLSPLERNRLRNLFAEAVETPPPQRRRWLEKFSATAPPAMCRALNSLLKAHDSASNFLAEPRLHFEPHPADALSCPSDVGPYSLIRELGRGGFGTVYLARHRVVGLVALKVLHPGMDSRQVLGRFAGEQEALSRMDHPAIARVMGSGKTEAGRPFFVMEWVDGPPITTAIHNNRLSLRPQLELFVEVCRGVQHAHQKGIIHRDIKPANVLLAKRDGRPIPKVIDFGVAKAVVGRLYDSSLVTENHQTIGTPAYMSPEQAALRPDIDTRTDVYGLGVLLYEMLAGAPPFDPLRLRESSPAQLQQIIELEEPPPPSRRLAADEGSAKEPGRRVELRKQASQVRGDLDWIVACAMAKEPSRRYPTADALAEDVIRYLGGHPVLARAPTAGYRFRKFATRSKGVLASLMSMAVALVAGITGILLALQRAEADRDRATMAQLAEGRQREVADRERAKAQRSEAAALDETRRTIAGQNFMYELLFPQGDIPDKDLPPSQALDYIIGRLDLDVIHDHPEIEAPLRMGLGLAYGRVGQYAQAEEQLTRYLQTYRRDSRNLPHFPVSTAYQNLSQYRAVVQDWPSAELYLRAALTECDGDAEASTRPMVTFILHRQLAEILLAQQKYAEAEEQWQICHRMLRDAREISDQEEGDVERLIDTLMTVGHAADATIADRICKEVESALADQRKRGITHADYKPFRPLQRS